MDIKTSPEKYKEKIHTAENLKDKDIEKLLERSVKIISSLSDKNYEICFEDAFGFIHSNFKKLGAEVFVNITDDSWSLTKSAEYQHFVVSWFRAIEFRTTMVRSTNSGFTAIVDPQGRIKDSLPLFKEAWLSAEVPVYKNSRL